MAENEDVVEISKLEAKAIESYISDIYSRKVPEPEGFSREIVVTISKNEDGNGNANLVVSSYLVNSETTSKLNSIFCLVSSFSCFVQFHA